jgi:hypothetical protein
MAPDHFRLVTCPNCLRSDFVNMQGFINHCRIVHTVEARSQAHAVRDWGKRFETEALDKYHPANTMKPFNEPNDIVLPERDVLNVAKGDSRFYLIKRVICGNVCMVI